MALPPPTNWERFKQTIHDYRVGLYLEKFYPIGLLVMALCVVYRMNIGSAEFEKLTQDPMYNAITVASIFAGFQGAIQAIFLSMAKSAVVRKIKEHKEPDGSNLYDDLLGYMKSGTFSLIIFIAAGMAISFFYSVGAFTSHVRILSALLVGLFIYSMASSVRIISIILKLIKIGGKE